MNVATDDVVRRVGEVDVVGDGRPGTKAPAYVVSCADATLAVARSAVTRMMKRAICAGVSGRL